MNWSLILPTFVGGLLLFRGGLFVADVWQRYHLLLRLLDWPRNIDVVTLRLEAQRLARLAVADGEETT